MSIFDSKCTTNLQLAERARYIAKHYKTLYVMGCFGAPLNDTNKARYTKNYSYNEDATRTEMINAASNDTFGFDCVCFIKGILWGWNGDLEHIYGGATYCSNDVPDIGADSMIKVCSDISTDFNNIEVGEAVWMSGHIGIYVGDGLAVESTPKWNNCVQLTACNQDISGYNRRDWTKHGKLPYVEYVQNVVPTKFELLDVVKIREGVTTYANGVTMSSWVPKSTLYVRKIEGNKITISTLKEGQTTGTVFDTDLVLIERANSKPPAEASTGSEADQRTMWNFLQGKFGNDFAVAGLMGNLYAESGFISINLQQSYEGKLGYTDITYTNAVDSGAYTNFVKDGAGYGLAQWTHWSRKQMMYDYIKSMSKSIGDYQAQLDFLWYELEKSFASLVKKLKAAISVKEASNLVLHNYERPADQSEAAENRRAGYCQKYYDKFHVETTEPEVDDTEQDIVEPDIVEPNNKNVIAQLLEAIVEFLISLFSKK